MRDGKRTLIATDRISAFDVVLGTIPFKGQVLNQMAAFWFEATADLVPNHVISVPDPTVTVRARVRAAAGRARHARLHDRRDLDVDLDAHYENGRAHLLRPRPPRGHEEEPEAARRPILTPSTKAAKGDHDVSVSRAEILAMGALERRGLRSRRRDVRARVRLRPGRVAAPRPHPRRHQVRDRPPPDGTLCFIDEIHTPDSSRYWYADDYEERFAKGEEPRGLDKEYVRRTLAEQGFKRRRARRRSSPTRCASRRRAATSRSASCITGRPFVPNTEEPIARIRRNLKLGA